VPPVQCLGQPQVAVASPIALLQDAGDHPRGGDLDQPGGFELLHMPVQLGLGFAEVLG
jgi:hypothetical protein